MAILGKRPQSRAWYAHSNLAYAVAAAIDGNPLDRDARESDGWYEVTTDIWVQAHEHSPSHIRGWHAE